MNATPPNSSMYEPHDPLNTHAILTTVPQFATTFSITLDTKGAKEGKEAISSGKRFADAAKTEVLKSAKSSARLAFCMALSWDSMTSSASAPSTRTEPMCSCWRKEI